MKKRRKIKSYGRIYRRRNPRKARALKILGFIALILAVGTIGYFAAGPVLNLIDGGGASSDPEPSSSAVPSDSSEGSGGSESTSVSESESEPEPEPEPEPAAVLHAVTLPFGTASDGKELKAFLDQAVGSGANAVIVELKETDGTLRYRSEVKEAEEYGAVAENALDAGTLAEAVRESGLVPIAKLSAFMDRIAPNASRDNGYLYGSTTSAWWDNSPQKGGKPWLNPYKEKACGYLLALQDELIEKGFDVIIWHKVEFPEVWSFSGANMGPEADGVSQQEALSAFVKRSGEAAEAKGAEAFFSYPVSAVFGPNQSWFGGDPTGIAAKNIAPEIDLDGFGKKLTIGEKTVDLSDSKTAVKEIMSAFLAKAGSAERIMPVIKDPSALEDAIQALQDLKIEEYAAP